MNIKCKCSVDFNKIYLGNDSCFVDMFFIDIFCLLILIFGIVILFYVLEGLLFLLLILSLI